MAISGIFSFLGIASNLLEIKMCFNLVSNCRSRMLKWNSLKVLLTLCFFSCICSLSAQTKPASIAGVDVGKQYVFLIAIDNYENWESVSGNVQAAKRFKNVLLSKYFVDNIIEVYDTDATKEKLVSELTSLKGLLKSSDSIVIYFSGHGYDDDTDNYWIPYNASNNDFEKTNWFSNTEFKSIIADINANHLLILTDAGFNKSFVTKEKLNSQSISDKQYKLKARQVISDEESFFDKITAVLSKNTNKYISSNQIYTAIATEKSSIVLGSLNNLGHASNASFFFLRQVIEIEQSATPMPIVVSTKSYGGAIIHTESGGELFIDGVKICDLGDSSISELSGLQTGEYTFELRFNDKDSLSLPVIIRPGITTSVRFNYLSDNTVAEIVKYDSAFEEGIDYEIPTVAEVPDMIPAEPPLADDGLLTNDETEIALLNQNSTAAFGIYGSLLFGGVNTVVSADNKNNKKALTYNGFPYSGAFSVRFDRPVIDRQYGYLGLQTGAAWNDAKLTGLENNDDLISLRRISIPLSLVYTTKDFNKFAFKFDFGAAVNLSFITYNGLTKVVLPPTVSTVINLGAIYRFNKSLDFTAGLGYWGDVNATSGLTDIPDSSYYLIPASFNLSLGVELKKSSHKQSLSAYRSLAQKQLENDFNTRNIHIIFGLAGGVGFSSDTWPKWNQSDLTFYIADNDKNPEQQLGGMGELLLRMEFPIKNGLYGTVGVQSGCDYWSSCLKLVNNVKSAIVESNSSNITETLKLMGVYTPFLISYTTPKLVGMALRGNMGLGFNIPFYSNSFTNYYESSESNVEYPNSGLSNAFSSFLIGADLIYYCNDVMSLSFGIRHSKALESVCVKYTLTDTIKETSNVSYIESFVELTSISLGLEFRVW